MDRFERPSGIDMRRHRLPIVAVSDTHLPDQVGSAYSVLAGGADSPPALSAALAGRRRHYVRPSAATARSEEREGEGFLGARVRRLLRAGT